MLTGITYSMELYITHTIQTFHIYLREGVNSPCNIHAHTATAIGASWRHFMQSYCD